MQSCTVPTISPFCSCSKNIMSNSALSLFCRLLIFCMKMYYLKTGSNKTQREVSNNYSDQTVPFLQNNPR